MIKDGWKYYVTVRTIQIYNKNVKKKNLLKSLFEIPSCEKWLSTSKLTMSIYDPLFETY